MDDPTHILCQFMTTGKPGRFDLLDPGDRPSVWRINILPGDYLMLRHLLVAAALLVPAAALAQTSPGWQKSTPGAAPAGQTAAPSAAPAATANTGKVLETQASGGYTYLRVDGGGQEQWIAVPQTTIPVGAIVQWSPGAVMQNFHSKTLNKTFPQILFSGGAQVVR